MAPTLGEMDMPLSLRMITRSVSRSATWFRPSKAMPPVMAPSPMTATTW